MKTYGELMGDQSLSDGPKHGDPASVPVLAALVRKGRARRAETKLRGDTREAILRAAGDLMIARNSVDITLAEIAEASGISPGLIIYHFTSKEGLLRALIAYDASHAVEQLRGLAGVKMPADRKMRRHIGGLVRAYSRMPYISRLIHALVQEASEDCARAVSEAFVQPVAAFQRDLLEQGRREGVFRAVDPADFYFMVTGACDHLFARRGLSRHGPAGDDVDDEAMKERYARSVTAMVMAGIAA